MLEVLDRLLERNHVSLPRNVFFDGTFSASSRSRDPARDAEPCLLEKTLGHAVVEAMLRLARKTAIGRGHRKRLAWHFLQSPSDVSHVERDV